MTKKKKIQAVAGFFRDFGESETQESEANEEHWWTLVNKYSKTLCVRGLLLWKEQSRLRATDDALRGGYCSYFYTYDPSAIPRLTTVRLLVIWPTQRSRWIPAADER
jgi:hypothetical protein